MANMTKYDPFGDIDDFFKGFMLRPVRYTQELPQIRIDVSEAQGAYVVRADIPGAKKEDIKVDVEGNLVTISAETRAESEKKEGERVVHSERSFGRVSRSFTVGQEVDEKGASAKYADGVLELRLPRKSAAAQAKIVVQ
jgi:HSP20 family protein